jgi:microcystin-dependent protein
MSLPFMGEIKIVSFNFAPKGWAMCNGQFLPINQNQALFALLGTTYGGNGQTTFALPNFQGRIPHHTGGQSGLTLGQVGGQAAHTVTSSEMPAHNHIVQASTSAGNQAFPASASPVVTHNAWATSSQNPYSAPANLVAMDPASVTNAGGSQAHENRQPYLVLNFIIALQGIFPSQT